MTGSLLLGIFCGLLALMLALYALMAGRGSSDRNIKRTHDVSGESPWRMVLYRYLSKSILTRRYLMEIRRRFEMAGSYREDALRRRTVTTFLWVLTAAVMVVMVFALASNSVITMIFAILVIAILSETVIDIFVLSLGNKLMADQIHFGKRLRHNYYELNNIIEALQISGEEISESHKEMAVQAYKIHNILTSKEVDQEIQDYNYTAPNKFLKQLLSLIYIAAEYGDGKDDQGRSQLMVNLSTLDEDIRLEVFKREKISYFFRSLNVIPLIPILCLGPFKSWAIGTFYPLGAFYESNMGVIVEIIMYCVTLISYVTIRNLQRIERAYRRGRQPLRDIRWLKTLVKYLIPLPYTSRRIRKEQLIRASGTRSTIEDHYGVKVLTSVALLVLALSTVLVLHRRTVETILNDPDIEAVQSTFLGASLGEEDMAEAERISQWDKSILLQTGMSENLDVIIDVLEEGKDLTEAELRRNGERIRRKALEINAQYIRWYEVIICLLLAAMGYHIPDMMLMYQRRIMKAEADNEVSMFQLIILMLMPIDRISVEEVLQWLATYSTVYKEELELCLIEYDAGPWVALEKMKQSVEHYGFREVTSGLQSAVNSLSIKASFEELEAEKAYFFKTREEASRRTIEAKQNGGSLVGFLPIYTFLVVYFAFPLLYVGMEETQKYFSQMMAV